MALYTDALTLDPTNYILYSNRSAARLKQGQFSLALQDAQKAKELCPQWGKAYFREGVALQCLRRYGEALAAFSAGLAQDANSKQLLSGLIEASIKSPLRAALEPTFHQLCAMKLDQVNAVSLTILIHLLIHRVYVMGFYFYLVTFCCDFGCWSRAIASRSISFGGHRSRISFANWNLFTKVAWFSV